MQNPGRYGLSGLFVLAGLLAACTGPAPPRAHRHTPGRRPNSPAATNGAQVYRLEPAASRVLVFVGKAGPLSGFGHVHVIRVGALRGFARIAASGRGHADLIFPVRALIVDPPAIRKGLGTPYSEHQPGAEARRGTRDNMLGPQVLDARHYPRVHLVVKTSTPPRQGKIQASISLTLHGVTRTFSAAVALHYTNHAMSLRGTFKIAQSDFGITPYSALLGALRVKDATRIRYHLVLSRHCFARSSRHAQPRPEYRCSE